jgi:ubiquitin-conjugating enzyme E2 H
MKYTYKVAIEIPKFKMQEPAVHSNNRRRIQTDVMKLMRTQHEVKFVRDDDVSNFHIRFAGPPGTPYDTGIWSVHVKLPDEYPYRPPYIRFRNKIFHPNIEESSGIVCLDVINQTWTPLYDLSNVFDTFLPQLLTHPNAMDPLNTTAAMVYRQNPEEFEKVVKQYIREYAFEEAAGGVEPMDVDAAQEDIGDDNGGSVSSLSDEDIFE